MDSELDSLTSDLIKAAFSVLKRDANPQIRPHDLYHFTDMDGLLGICRDRCLWASLATSLNDQSEVAYGIDRARLVLQSGKISAPDVFLETVHHYLDPTHRPAAARIDWRSFIVSFCGRADRSTHWLHYGRSGAGFAIAFDGTAVQKAPFDLIQIVYEQDRQDELLRSVILAVANRFEAAVPGGPTNKAHELFRTVTHLTAQALWAAAPRLKNPVFASEDEWRLITSEFEGLRIPDGLGDVPMESRFRASAGRIIPYKELLFGALPITEIILGSAVPMEPEDPGLTLLLCQALLPRIRRSEVPVRP